jgi:hypothetical protein
MELPFGLSPAIAAPRRLWDIPTTGAHGIHLAHARELRNRGEI